MNMKPTIHIDKDLLRNLIKYGARLYKFSLRLAQFIENPVQPNPSFSHFDNFNLKKICFRIFRFGRQCCEKSYEMFIEQIFSKLF